MQGKGESGGISRNGLEVCVCVGTTAKPAEVGNGKHWGRKELCNGCFFQEGEERGRARSHAQGGATGTKERIRGQDCLKVWRSRVWDNPQALQSTWDTPKVHGLVQRYNVLVSQNGQ